MPPHLFLMATVFLGTLGAVLVAQFYATRAQRSVGQRMRTIVEGLPDQASAPGAHGVGDYFPMVTARLQETSYFHRVERRLVAAGVPLRAAEFITICILVGAAGFLTAAVWSHQPVRALIWGAVGFASPHLVLNALAERRRQVLEAQLADTLVMISSALQAGFSFLQGVQMAADQMPQPIGGELQRMVRLVQLGMPVEEALNQLGDRVQSCDYDLMIAATTLQLATGGNLIRLFKTITETIQERLRIRGEIQATTAEGRLSAMVLIALPVIMLVVLMVIKPDYAHSMLFHPTGVAMLKGAGILQIIGILAIRRILSLDL